jgi:Hydrophobic surface binding protein A
MHFITIISVGLLACFTTAAPTSFLLNVLNPRATSGLPDVQAAFNKIQDSIAKMVEDINKWDGQAPSSAPIFDSAKTLLATIKASTTSISGSSSIGLMDAVNILGPVNTLSNKVDDVVTALLTKKGAFDASKMTGQVSEQLVQDQAATKELIKAILGRLPSMTIPIAQPIADGVSQKLDKAVTAYGSGGAAPAAPASAAPATDPPAPAAKR